MKTAYILTVMALAAMPLTAGAVSLESTKTTGITVIRMPRDLTSVAAPVIPAGPIGTLAKQVTAYSQRLTYARTGVLKKAIDIGQELLPAGTPLYGIQGEDPKGLIWCVMPVEKRKEACFLPVDKRYMLSPVSDRALSQISPWESGPAVAAPVIEEKAVPVSLVYRVEVVLRATPADDQMRAYIFNYKEDGAGNLVDPADKGNWELLSNWRKGNVLITATGRDGAFVQYDPVAGTFTVKAAQESDFH